MLEDKHKVLAIIPARGGSKGVPRKNIRELCGKPLIAYSIEVALKARLIDRVLVSTEDAEIAEISGQYGAEVPFLRPKEIAGDRSNIADAVNHCLFEVRKNGYHPDAVVTLYPTHLFRTVSLVDSLTEKLLNGCGPVNTVKSVTHSRLSVFSREVGGCLAPLLSRYGSEDIVKERRFYRQYGLFIGASFKGRTRPYIHEIDNPICLIDIDELSDFLLAEEVINSGLFDFDF